MSGESVADQIHDWLSGKSSAAPGSGVIIPSNNGLGAPPLPVDKTPPLTGDPVCKLHHPNQVSRAGSAVDTEKCSHCLSIAGPYIGAFDNFVASLKGLSDAGKTNVKYLLMAIACSESEMNPAAIGYSKYDVPVAFGLMQIGKGNLSSYGMTQKTALTSIQKNIAAGGSVFAHFYTHYLNGGADVYGAAADAIAAYKGCLFSGTYKPNWNRVIGGRTVKQIVAEVLKCYIQLGGQVHSA